MRLSCSWAARTSFRELVPGHGYSYQYRSSAASEATYSDRGNRAIPAAVESLLDLVARRVDARPLNLAGGVQLSLADYPSNAVREVVVNALIHRDFRQAGRSMSSTRQNGSRSRALADSSRE